MSCSGPVQQFIKEKLSPLCSMISTPRVARPSARKRRATSSPAASSPRSTLPQPIMRRAKLITLQMQAEEMGGAGNTGIVVAHRLFTLPGDFLGRPSRNLADKMPKIFLDPFLILRGGRDDLCGIHEPALIERVAVIEKSAGRFGGGLPG